MFYRAANGYNLGMTMTGVRVEVVPVQAERDEAEVAAVVAAVFAVLKSRGGAEETIENSRDSNWALASRMEATGDADIKEAPSRTAAHRSAWWSARSALVSLLTAVSFSLLCAGAASAEDNLSNTENQDLVAAAPQSALNESPVAAALPAPSFDKFPLAVQAAMPSYPVSQVVPNRSGQVIRILLTKASKTPDLAMLDGASIVSLSNMKPVYQVAAGSRFQLNCANGKLAFNGADSYSVAQVAPSSNYRQVVAMTPRVSPGLSGLKFSGPTVSKFSLAFDLPSPSNSSISQPSAQGSTPGSAAAATTPTATPAPKGGVRPVGYLVVPSTKDGLLSYSGRVYRGAIWLKPIRTATDVSFQAINLIDLEDYLLSVVPSEMPSSWSKEAVKAQSIAARSYAVANYWKNERDGYDLKDTTDDQVYLGVESETTAGNLACDETSGIVLKHNNKVISAFFHSTSGGATEVGENVWGKEIPYVQSVVDYDDNSPHFSWQRRFTIDQSEKAFGLKDGALLSIQPFWKVASNRVKHAAVVSQENTTIVTGERLRQLFKLPSSIFNVSFEDGCYIFAGRGFGHGLGMSQYGAKALAESGYNAAQILSYYYRDVSVEYLNRAPGI